MSKIKNKIVLLGIASYLVICDYGIEVKSLSCIKFSSKRNSSNIKVQFQGVQYLIYQLNKVLLVNYLIILITKIYLLEKLKNMKNQVSYF